MGEVGVALHAVEALVEVEPMYQFCNPPKAK
jgi:hypothetical protein